MTHTEYKMKIDGIDKQVEALQDERAALVDDFIAKNAAAKVGDKVRVIGTYFGRPLDEIAFVKHVRYNHKSNEFQYFFYKAKKDGTRSANKLYVNTIESIEKI